ncbi:Sodium, potassium, lithium and rubidium/H(+) antiporter [Arthrobacter saudimassiliensis]|uniref:Sodium, potassium, lithium and rubidium/H(+) antiporter n=1 Tax=Arthrobacter saudimassiliensis TaxID=1461584 RepID=A0A078MS95_9MICC|nr:Sodium, potassium, lithium and rubidium/H(+) antiporter [Arthrobacter saudimassiliensis]
MLGLELVVILSAAVLACNLAARRLHIAPPLLLVVAGVLLGFIPALREVQLPSDVVLLLFLPALLYWESLTTSLREIRSNLRGIVMMSTVLVIATAAGVAAVGHALGMSWGAAWVLGAAVAPTDATAVAALARALPARSVTLLRAESLVNDGTALVLYALAVSLTVGEQDFSTPVIVWLFILSYIGGAAAGVATARAGILLRRWAQEPLLGNVITFLTPFTAFLLAELIGASGVLAVVVSGLIMSQVGPRVVPAQARRQAEAFWSFSTFLLNGALFVLIGIELHAVVRGLTRSEFGLGLLAVALVSAAIVAVRFGFLFATDALIRATARLRGRRPGSLRAQVVSGAAGFRGAVSLAAALGVPLATTSGGPFPDRGLIIFVTAGVIVVTLVVQGPLLPLAAAWARLPSDAHLDRERLMAETAAGEEALQALPRLAAELGTAPEMAERTRNEYRIHLQVLRAGGQGAGDQPILRLDRDYTRLRLSLVARKRRTVVRLRDEGRIDDAVLRRIQARLDLEELRLTGIDPPE